MHVIMNVRKSRNPHLCPHFHEDKRYKHTHGFFLILISLALPL